MADQYPQLDKRCGTACAYAARVRQFAEQREVSFDSAMTELEARLEQVRWKVMPDHQAILLALLFGDRQYLDQATLNNFIAATLVHSLALSGQHLVIAGISKTTGSDGL